MLAVYSVGRTDVYVAPLLANSSTCPPIIWDSYTHSVAHSKHNTYLDLPWTVGSPLASCLDPSSPVPHMLRCAVPTLPVANTYLTTAQTIFELVSIWLLVYRSMSRPGGGSAIFLRAYMTGLHTGLVPYLSFLIASPRSDGSGGGSGGQSPPLSPHSHAELYSIPRLAKKLRSLTSAAKQGLVLLDV